MHPHEIRKWLGSCLLLFRTRVVAGLNGPLLTGLSDMVWLSIKVRAVPILRRIQRKGFLTRISANMSRGILAVDHGLLRNA